MRTAELPDGTILEFPDKTPDEAMDRAVRSEMIRSGQMKADAGPHTMRQSIREEMKGQGAGSRALMGAASPFMGEEGKHILKEGGTAARLGKFGADVATVIPVLRGTAAVGRAAKLAPLARTLAAIGAGGTTGAIMNPDDRTGGALAGAAGVAIPGALGAVRGNVPAKEVLTKTMRFLRRYPWLPFAGGAAGGLPSAGTVGTVAAGLGAAELSKQLPILAQSLGYGAAEQVRGINAP